MGAIRCKVKRPIVAFVLSLPSSIIRFRLDLLRQFLAEGFRVVCVGPKADTATVETLGNLGVDYHEVPLKRQTITPLADLRYLFCLVQLFLQLRPSLTFCYTLKPVVYGTLAGAIVRLGLRVSMITGLGWTFANKSRKADLVRRGILFLYRITLRLNHVVFFQNQDDFQFFRQAGLLNQSSVVEVIGGSGVDTAIYRQSEPRVKPVTFVMVARLLRSKGVQEFVAASAELKRR